MKKGRKVQIEESERIKPRVREETSKRRRGRERRGSEKGDVGER